ncbi:hypothetical protein H072_798 [Dactylellina haptotyla CBS 200.50]|uniref:Uncharacterized protein n=1 Tax=Dactylellina haptotyla (strain CBS 200.50) TaxID=1284197 RepID=S8AQQ5_DACHA|nr:hypothetical protein H072_798 [Dactylellina haptotyla CBS 200.50]
MANQNSPSHDGQAVSTATEKGEFADILNLSAYKYAKFCEAEFRYVAAERDLRRSKSESSVFPNIYDRSYARYDNAKKEYDIAAKERHQASDALNTLLSRLFLVSDSRADPVCNHPTDFALHESTKTLADRIQVVELDLKRNNEMCQDLVRQAQEQHLQNDINRLSQNQRDLRRDIDQLNSQCQGVNLLLKLHIKTNIEKAMELDRRTDEMDTRIQKNHTALESAEDAFDKIYQRLEITEQQPRYNKPAHEPSQIRAGDEPMTFLESSMAQIEPRPHKKTPRPPGCEFGSVENIQTYLEDFKETSRAELASRLVPLESVCETVMSKLEQHANEIRDFHVAINKNIQQQARDFDSFNASIVDIQGENISNQERSVALDDQIQGLIMTVKHINKKFDEFSADEIVMKINMSLRNASSKSVTHLQSLLRGVLEKIELVERRLTTVEHLIYPAKTQNQITLSTG